MSQVFAQLQAQSSEMGKIQLQVAKQVRATAPSPTIQLASVVAALVFLLAKKPGHQDWGPALVERLLSRLHTKGPEKAASTVIKQLRLVAPELEGDADAILEELPALPALVGAAAAAKRSRPEGGGGPHKGGLTCREAGHEPSSCILTAKRKKEEKRSSRPTLPSLWPPPLPLFPVAPCNSLACLPAYPRCGRRRFLSFPWPPATPSLACSRCACRPALLPAGLS